MCGIAAIYNYTPGTLRHEAIQRMTAEIVHRGPDAAGMHVNAHVALGHRRLSIIDVKASANQPMWDYSKRYAIIFNGEIYNYRELKQALPDYPYKTDSDTEVIFAYYEKLGAACLEKFNGMFAFAIWDEQKKQLFIARDRVGKKPLYYADTPEFFVMCSDVRGILQSGLLQPGLAEEQLTEYLMYQAPMTTHSLVKGVYKLSAGSYAIIKTHPVEEHTYWSYTNATKSNDDLTTAKKKVRDLLLDAVQLRMRSDVPFGAFLSGGIDSSLVVACMSEFSTQPVETFNVSFTESDYDESGYAEQVAKQYKTNHHRILLKPEIFLDSMDAILQAMDTPSGDGPNTYIVAQHTRQAGIKVALSGLGGDELFAGYNKFMMYHRLMQRKWMAHLPVPLRKGISAAAGMVKRNQQSAKIKELFALPHWRLGTVYPLLRQAYSMAEANSLLKKPNDRDAVSGRLDNMHHDICWMGHFSKATIAEMECYTRDVLLRDTDQMAMAHALEVRVPFFDYRLIEYVLSLPDNYKYPRTPKQLLVDAMAPRLPKEVIHRKKMGFSLPYDRWLRNELSEMADSKINYLVDRKEFNGDEVLRKWNNYRAGDKTVLWSRIWGLIILSDWLQRNQL